MGSSIRRHRHHDSELRFRQLDRERERPKLKETARLLRTPEPEREPERERFRPQPTLRTALEGRALHTANSGAAFRAFQLQRDFEARPTSAPSPVPSAAPALGPSAAAPVPTDRIELTAEQQEAQAVYERWSDHATLERELNQRGNNLNGFTPAELQALAALSIDKPEIRETLQDATINTVRDAESLEDIPSDVPFQHLLNTFVIDPPEELRENGSWSVAHANYRNMVEEEVGEKLDARLDGARGDDGLDGAIEDFTGDLEDFIREQPAAAEFIEEVTREQFETRDERFHDIRRADDPWYADINHAVTGGVRSLASAVADTIFPESNVNRNTPYIGPAADFFNHPTVREATLFAAGFNAQGRGSVESLAELVADPVGSARALVEVVKDPSLLLAGYEEAYEQYGTSGLAGAVGFDLMTAAIGAGSAAPRVSSSRLRDIIRAGRLADEIPTGDLSRRFLDDVAELGEAQRYLDLPEGLREDILHAIGSNPADDLGRRGLIDLVKSEGFGELDLPEQERLVRYAGGENPYISGPARAQLNALMSDDAFRALSPSEQADRLRYFTSAESPSYVIEPPPGTYRPQVDATIGPGQAASYAFDSAGTGPAQRHVVNIDGRNVEVIVPDNLGPGNHTTLEQAVAGLRSMPEANRRAIDRIVLEPSPDPRNGTYESGASSYMTAGADGTVRIYPTDAPQSFEALASTMVHETAHVVSHRAWGSPTAGTGPNGGTQFQYSGADWDAYRRAAQEDGVLPSGYAATDIGEDLAETWRLYSMVEGTAFEAEVRALYANRFALIDELNGS